MNKVKVVLNKAYGSYHLSKKAYKELGLEWDNWGIKYKNDRTNPDLIRVVEKLGKNASHPAGNLVVVEFDISDFIVDHDGFETLSFLSGDWGP